MGNEKLTKDEVQKQMYSEIKPLREHVAKCDDDIEFFKEIKKDNIKEASLNGLKIIAGLVIGGVFTLGLLYGCTKLALNLPKSYWQLLLAFGPASLALGATIGFLIEPIKDVIDNIREVSDCAYQKELKQTEKQPFVEKLNMLESMNDEEARKYIKTKLSKDETLLESFIYYHNKKKNKERQKQTPVKKDVTLEENKDDTLSK